MANLLWAEGAPADTDSAGVGAAEIRSLKTSVRNGMAEEHFWPSATGGNFGVHLLGSARPYYGAQSLVSSSGSDGRLMVTSDTSRLFHVGSAGTMFLGSQRVLSAGSAPVGGQTFYWIAEFGAAKSGSTGAIAVIWPNNGFNGVPFVAASADTTKFAVVTCVRAAGIPTFYTWDENGNPLSNCTFTYISIGTREFAQG